MFVLIYRGIRYIEVRYIEVLFHTFYYNFGRNIENRSLYRGVPYIEVRYCDFQKQANSAKSLASSETQGFNGEGGGKEMGARKTRKRWGEGRGREKGKGKPWASSLHRAFLDRRANPISEV